MPAPTTHAEWAPLWQKGGQKSVARLTGLTTTAPLKKAIKLLIKYGHKFTVAQTNHLVRRQLLKKQPAQLSFDLCGLSFN